MPQLVITADITDPDSGVVKNLLHCETGPAIVTEEGTKLWYRCGRIHRLDGPAVEWSDGAVEYWIDGSKIVDELTIFVLRSGKTPSNPLD